MSSEPFVMAGSVEINRDHVEALVTGVSWRMKIETKREQFMLCLKRKKNWNLDNNVTLVFKVNTSSLHQDPLRRALNICINP